MNFQSLCFCYVQNEVFDKSNVCKILSQQVGWLNGKGVCLQSKGQRIKPHEWCCVWSTMVC
jgi:hypothetical protein